MSRAQTVIFIALYYLNWFACLILAKHAANYMPLLVSMIASTSQWVFCLKMQKNYPYLLWVILFSVVGLSIDTLLLNFNIIIYQANPWSPLAPPWILALWLNFGLLCCALQTQLYKFIVYMPICAGFGFPLAYFGGMQFEVAQFNALATGPFILGGIWALLFPLLIWRLANDK